MRTTKLVKFLFVFWASSILSTYVFMPHASWPKCRPDRSIRKKPKRAREEDANSAQKWPHLDRNLLAYSSLSVKSIHHLTMTIDFGGGGYGEGQHGIKPIKWIQIKKDGLINTTFLLYQFTHVALPLTRSPIIMRITKTLIALFVIWMVNLVKVSCCLTVISTKHANVISHAVHGATICAQCDTRSTGARTQNTLEPASAYRERWRKHPAEAGLRGVR